MEKEKKLRPPTDEDLKELFRGIIQESHNPRLSRGLDLALEGLFTDDCP